MFYGWKPYHVHGRRQDDSISWVGPAQRTDPASTSHSGMLQNLADLVQGVWMMIMSKVRIVLFVYMCIHVHASHHRNRLVDSTDSCKVCMCVAAPSEELPLIARATFAPALGFSLSSSREASVVSPLKSVSSCPLRCRPRFVFSLPAPVRCGQTHARLTW